MNVTTTAHDKPRVGAAIVFMSLALLAAAPLAAQEEEPPVPLGKVAMLAFFLDSVDTQPRHTGLVGVTYSARRTPSGREWEEPAVYCVYGVSRRIDVSLSVPRSRAEYDDGYRSSGMGDRFLSIKVRVRDSDKGRLGLAFEPTLEILGQASLSAGAQGPGKYNFALPLIVQREVAGMSVFGEAGYITRGALFAGLGADRTLFSRVGIGVNLLYSRATSDSPINQEYGLRRSRADVLGGVYCALSSRWTLLASAGRTISKMDANATRRIVNVGVTYRFDVYRSRRRAPRSR